MRINKLAIFTVVILAAAAFFMLGGYSSMVGTVVDAVTGLPIEGAVVLVEWTVEKGVPGMMVTERVKVTESITDKEGKVVLSGMSDPSVNPPLIVIYKLGYVAWRSDFIFPDYKKRKDFKWGSEYVFGMEGFKKGYSHSRHISFFRVDLSLDSSSKLEEAYKWERPMARKEEELYREKQKTLKPGEISNQRIWEGILQELYFQKGGGTK